MPAVYRSESWVCAWLSGLEILYHSLLAVKSMQIGIFHENCHLGLPPMLWNMVSSTLNPRFTIGQVADNLFARSLPWWPRYQWTHPSPWRLDLTKDRGPRHLCQYVHKFGVMFWVQIASVKHMSGPGIACHHIAALLRGDEKTSRLYSVGRLDRPVFSLHRCYRSNYQSGWMIHCAYRAFQSAQVKPDWHSQRTINSNSVTVTTSNTPLIGELSASSFASLVKSGL
jgi:hypothetical protein